MDTNHPAHHPGPDLAPSHAEIEACARELWTNFGCPLGRNTEIWLEAERRLIAARRAPLPAAEPHAPRG